MLDVGHESRFLFFGLRTSLLYQGKNRKKKFLSQTRWEIRKIRDHCHITEKYRGAGHVTCNLNTRKLLSSFLLIALHHHVIMKRLFFTALVTQNNFTHNSIYRRKLTENLHHLLTAVLNSSILLILLILVKTKILNLVTQKFYEKRNFLWNRWQIVEPKWLTFVKVSKKYREWQTILKRDFYSY